MPSARCTRHLRCSDGWRKGSHSVSVSTPARSSSGRRGRAAPSSAATPSTSRRGSSRGRSPARSWPATAPLRPQALRSSSASREVERALELLARGSLDVLEILADEAWLRRQTWFALPSAAVRLDVFAIVGSAADIEGAFAPSGSYVEPFANRALGVARGDEALLAVADRRFRALGLDWHADQTSHLAELRKTARS